MIALLKKKISKKISEIQKYRKYVRWYQGEGKVILLELPRRTKVRTYLNLIIRLNESYHHPIVVKFSPWKFFILARWFKDFPNLYFVVNISRNKIFKKLSTSSKSDIKVDFNYSNVFNSKNYLDNVLPYIMHPANYLLEQPELLPKSVGIVISGNVNQNIYNTNHMKKWFGIENRWNVYQELIQNSNSVQINGTEYMEATISKKYLDKLVLMKWDSGAIAIEKWRSYLSASKFMWCAPGMTMPLCHNILEAMSVGVVPILNYADWLNPSLEDGKNCLVYETLEEIPDVIERALQITDEVYVNMQDEVCSYYHQYYESFNFEALSSLTILNETQADIKP